MSMIIRKTDSQTSKLQYRNVVDTASDQITVNQHAQLSLTQDQILQRNFRVLEEFLKTFKAQHSRELALSSEFKEQWQNNRKDQYELKYSYFFRESHTYLAFNLALLVCQIVLLWFLSVFRVYKCEDNQFIFTFCLILQILDLSLKSAYLIVSTLKQQNTGFFKIKAKDLVEIYLENVYCIFYSILGIFEIITSVQNLYFLVLDIAAILLIFHRMKEIENDVKMVNSNSELKNYIKLFNLMSTLIMIIHFFAVLMHYSTNFTSTNYLTNEVISVDRTWINLYIESFYFSATTVLTVGYGDILPKNIIEIFIVMLMQIFGVVMIVYLNGQVGNILCSLRREKENMENDLSVLERLKSSFKLSLQTTQRIRQYLIDNRRADEENSVHQQKSLLQKISPGLREEVTLTNHINIIKQSMFLLSNFTSKAHISISNKLISRIYSPNECLNQNTGSQKLFFLKKGEICLYVNKKYDDQNSNSRKILKTIKVSLNEKSQCNCFGYVSLIMGKSNRLKAFSNDFSDCYSINKQQFIEAINWYSQDFEKFHEMRENYMTSRNPEKIEAPDFFSQKDHYICDLVRARQKYHKQQCNSKRKKKFRGQARRKLIVQIFKEHSHFPGTDSDCDSNFGSNKVLKTEETGQNSCLSLKERKKKYDHLLSQKALNGSAPNNLVVQRKYVKRYCKRQNTDLRIGQNKKLGNSVFFSEPFQVVCSYSFFFSDSNIEMVIRNINYYLQVLSIFTNVFERALITKTKDSDDNCANSSDTMFSAMHIEEYRRQKNFIESIVKFRQSSK